MHPVECDNPYTELLAASVPARVSVDPFTWRAAFRGRYEVLHFHWPESDLRGRLHPLRALRLLALVVLNRARHRRLVWTVHNDRPHDGIPFLSRASLAAFIAAVDGRIFLSRSHAQSAGAQATDAVVPHGDYAAVIRPHIDPSTPRERVRRIVLFGKLRRYKGIEALIEAFAALDPEGWSLVIVGDGADRPYLAEIQEAAAGAKHISVRAEILTDSELAHLVAGSACTVIPYRAIRNSGSALYALTCRTPVLAPAAGALIELQREVGSSWLSLYSGELTPGVLSEFLANAQGSPEGGPDFSQRSWGDIGLMHADFYELLVGRREPCGDACADRLGPHAPQRAGVVDCAIPSSGRSSAAGKAKLSRLKRKVGGLVGFGPPSASNTSVGGSVHDKPTDNV